MKRFLQIHISTRTVFHQLRRFSRKPVFFLCQNLHQLYGESGVTEILSSGMVFSSHSFMSRSGKHRFILLITHRHKELESRIFIVFHSLSVQAYCSILIQVRVNFPDAQFSDFSAGADR